MAYGINRYGDLDINKLSKKDPEGIGFWIIENAMKTKLKINREEFLKKALGNKVSPPILEEAIKNGTSCAGIPIEIIRTAADKCISESTTTSNGASAVTGLPGSIPGTGSIFCMTVGAVLDIIQFYSNFIILMQKLLYLYGMMDISCFDDIKDNNKQSANIILIFIGVASGLTGLNKSVKLITKGLTKKYSKQASKLILLAKPKFYSTAKKIAQHIGIQITKKGFAKGASKVVPVVGAGLSAGINWLTYKPMAKRLKNVLDENYNKPFDEDFAREIEIKLKHNTFLLDSSDLIKEHADIYYENKKTAKTKTREKISLECLEFIEELCKQASFCTPDGNIFKLVNVKKEDCLLCHDDTKKSHSRGFIISYEGIHSFIDPKRKYHFISFEQFAEITAFSAHTHKSPINPHKFIEARIHNIDLISILPYEKIPGGKKTIIPFLTAIRDACWVDLYM